MTWKELTELAKEKRGVSIALTLPEEDESKILEKVIDQIKLDDLKKETGLETPIVFLDKYLAKDDLPDSLTKFEEFEDYSRSVTQITVHYIGVFMLTIVESVKKKGMKWCFFMLTIVESGKNV